MEGRWGWKRIFLLKETIERAAGNAVWQLAWPYAAATLELAAKVRETFEAGKLNNGEGKRVTRSNRAIERYEPHDKINNPFDHLSVLRGENYLS